MWPYQYKLIITVDHIYFHLQKENQDRQFNQLFTALIVLRDNQIYVEVNKNMMISCDSDKQMSQTFIYEDNKSRHLVVDFEKKTTRKSLIWFGINILG